MHTFASSFASFFQQVNKIHRQLNTSSSLTTWIYSCRPRSSRHPAPLIFGGVKGSHETVVGFVFLETMVPI